ncbi:DinB family protein [Arthrobacter sp. H14]|uniref:DinB family protein n=1 Tax=Arthrobacter sp. H14 TaxID=1312959 RepID=UPI00047C78DF|nr:DinB family protein [Arthrobacter sp. H14]
MDVNKELADQLAWHWDHQLRARLDGLTDEEYFWEPVPGCWNLRPVGTSTAPMAVGVGDYTIDFGIPEPQPAPVTTIAWRLAHILVAVLGARNASHFGGPATEYRSYDYPASAAEALERLDAGYQLWIEGVRGLGTEGLDRPCGEDGFETWPMGSLVLHINREMIHHGAEIALLRDLYAHSHGQSQSNSIQPGI